MIAAPIILLLASAAVQADRLDYDTKWHCVSPFADAIEADLAIVPGEAGSSGKRLIFTRSSTPDIPVGTAGYGSERADKNSFYDPRQARKDPDYPYAEYMQGFYGAGVSVCAMWWAGKPEIELTIHTFDEEHRQDPERRNEKVFALTCRLAS